MRTCEKSTALAQWRSSQGSTGIATRQSFLNNIRDSMSCSNFDLICGRVRKNAGSYCSCQKAVWTLSSDKPNLMLSSSLIQDFWCLHHFAYSPSQFEYVDYALFKKGISPAWQDVGDFRSKTTLVTLETPPGHTMCSTMSNCFKPNQKCCQSSLTKLVQAVMCHVASQRSWPYLD